MMTIVARLRAKLFPAGSGGVSGALSPATETGADQVSPPAGKPAEVKRRKGLGKGQLAWCRKNIRYNGDPIFASMEAAARSAGLIQRKRP